MKDILYRTSVAGLTCSRPLMHGSGVARCTRPNWTADSAGISQPGLLILYYQTAVEI